MCACIAYVYICIYRYTRIYIYTHIQTCLHQHRGLGQYGFLAELQVSLRALEETSMKVEQL